MRLTIAAIGRLKAGPEKDLAARYLDRSRKAGKALGVSPIDMVEFAESRAANTESRKAEEGRHLLARLPEKSQIIAFDERGAAPTSRAFASQLRNCLDEGSTSLALLIGGPDGLDQTIRDAAHTVISFGRLTLPHQLVRVMVLEQVYRATTILSGHPYHRD